MAPKGRTNSRHWLCLLVVAAIILHFAMMGSLFWGYFDRFIYSADRSTKALDFFSIYEAGHNVLRGHSVYVDYVIGDKAPYLSPYRYVPAFAYWVGAPLNLLRPWWAYWAWVAFNELLLVANAYTTWRIAGKSAWGLVGVAMWFLFTPFYLELYLGQFSFLMATALFWTAIGFMRGRELLAGIPWAASLIAKSNSALLAPIFLRLAWWRSLALGTALVALNGFYFLWQPDDLRIFIKKNFTEAASGSRYAQYWPAQHGLSDLIENAYLAIRDSHATTPDWLTALPAVAIVVISLAVTFFIRRVDTVALFAIWCAAFFLAYTEVWEFHYVMLLPALVLLVIERPPLRPLALAVFVMVALPAPYWPLAHFRGNGPPPMTNSFDQIQDTWQTWQVVLFHAWKPIPTLVLWGALVWARYREGLTLEPVAGALAVVHGAIRARIQNDQP
jgi:hypothetical protein